MVDISLVKEPSFGFESIHYRAKDAEDTYANKELAEHKKASGGSTVKQRYYKAVIKDILKGEEKYKHQLSLEKMHRNNAVKVLGYVPGIGTICGFERLYTIIKDRGELHSRMDFLRSAIEILSLGILLMPVDIAITFVRQRKWKKLNQM